MEYLKIQNKGELDVRLISLMGGSTKQSVVSQKELVLKYLKIHEERYLNGSLL